MSSSALDSQGMVIKVALNDPPTIYSAIDEVKSIDGPGGQANEVDVTDLSSTAKEFVLGLQDEGDISLDINYIPGNSTHILLRAARQSGDVTGFQIIFTDSPATTWTFLAIVKGFSISNAVDGITGGSVALRVTGSITES